MIEQKVTPSTRRYKRALARLIHSIDIAPSEGAYWSALGFLYSDSGSEELEYFCEASTKACDHR
jgi:hypothetical protein